MTCGFKIPRENVSFVVNRPNANKLYPLGYSGPSDCPAATGQCVTTDTTFLAELWHAKPEQALEIADRSRAEATPAKAEKIGARK